MNSLLIMAVLMTAPSTDAKAERLERENAKLHRAVNALIHNQRLLIKQVQEARAVIDQLAQNGVHYSEEIQRLDKLVKELEKRKKTSGVVAESRHYRRRGFFRRRR